jgi:hypothetical protein
MRNLGLYKNIVGKLEVERSLWRSRRRWKDNIKMHLRKVRCGEETGLKCFKIRSSGELI